MSNLPIHFIVGPHRSGSTYLQTTLASLPDIGTCSETHFFCRVLPYLRKFKEMRRKSIRFSDLRNAIIRIMFLGDDKIDFWDELEKSFFCGSYKDLFSCLVEGLSYKINPNARVLIEKTPSHLFFVDDIRRTYPTSKIIVIVRDPRNIATSMLRFLPNLTQVDRWRYLFSEIKYLHQCFAKIREIEANRDDNMRLTLQRNLKI